MFSQFKKYIPAILWASFILFATIANVSTLEHLSLEDLFAYDKLIHMILFGVQAYLLIYARLKDEYTNPQRIIFYMCLVSAAFGALTEVLQGWLTTSRTFDYFDMLADVLGCVIVYIWQSRKHKVVVQ